MRNKITTAAEAVAVIQNGDALCTSGFVGIGVPDALLVALEKRFLETGGPRDLTLLFAAGQGDGKDRGLNALGHDGLLRRVVGGPWTRVSSALSRWGCGIGSSTSTSPTGLPMTPSATSCSST